MEIVIYYSDISEYWVTESRQSMNNYTTTLESNTLQHLTIASNSLLGISRLYTTVFLDFSDAISVYGVSEVD